MPFGSAPKPLPVHDVIDAFDALFGPSKVAGVQPWVKAKAKLALPPATGPNVGDFGHGDYSRVAKAYGFTAREIEAWVRANDAGVSFEVLAEILRTTPVPHTTQYTPDRRKMESTLLARLHTAIVKHAKNVPPGTAWGVTSWMQAKASVTIESITGHGHKAAKHDHGKKHQPTFQGSDPLPSVWHIPYDSSPSQAAVDEIAAIAAAGPVAFAPVDATPPKGPIDLLGVPDFFAFANDLMAKMAKMKGLGYTIDAPPQQASAKLWVVKDGVTRPPTGCEAATSMPVLWKKHPAFPGFVLPL